MPITPEPRPGSSGTVADVVDGVVDGEAGVVVTVVVSGGDETVDGGSAVVVVPAGEPEQAARTTTIANPGRHAFVAPFFLFIAGRC